LEFIFTVFIKDIILIYHKIMNEKKLDLLNEEIVKKSKFDIIGNMTVAQLFDEYLKSAEFEKEVVKLRNEGNDDSYIKDYIVKAFGFINYFH